MAEQKKLNCWEYFQCGREEGGKKAAEPGPCPASTASREIANLQGIHDGKNGGRCCWIITGTIHNGKVQGSFAEKFGECSKCKFYELVKREEGANFKLSRILLDLKNKKSDQQIWLT